MCSIIKSPAIKRKNDICEWENGWSLLANYRENEAKEYKCNWAVWTLLYFIVRQLKHHGLNIGENGAARLLTKFDTDACNIRRGMKAQNRWSTRCHSPFKPAPNFALSQWKTVSQLSRFLFPWGGVVLFCFFNEVQTGKNMLFVEREGKYRYIWIYRYSYLYIKRCGGVYQQVKMCPVC